MSLALNKKLPLVNMLTDLKHSFHIGCLLICAVFLSPICRAEIISLDSPFGEDTITYDTDTGLQWLDVTVTQGLSYDNVTAEMVVGGAYEGWRYATVQEFDQLVVNFGYVAVNSCPWWGRVTLHCDISFVGGQAELIEEMILTLGDIFVNSSDFDRENGYEVLGAGYTHGILATQYRYSGRYDMASIFDKELIRSAHPTVIDFSDHVRSIADSIEADNDFNSHGSFLVAETGVSVPAVEWWFPALLLAVMSRITMSIRSGWLS